MLLCIMMGVVVVFLGRLDGDGALCLDRTVLENTIVKSYWCTIHVGTGAVSIIVLGQGSDRQDSG